MDKDQARKALLGLNLAVGVAFLLFPRLSMRLYGLDPDEDARAAYPLRYLGARSLLLAGMLADDDAGDLLLKKTPVVAGTDAAVNVLAAVTGEVPKRVVLLGALTSALGTWLSLASQED